jgi:hypothetical protein
MYVRFMGWDELLLTLDGAWRLKEGRNLIDI